MWTARAPVVRARSRPQLRSRRSRCCGIGKWAACANHGWSYGAAALTSVGTIHNIAHRADLRSAVPIPKPKLTPEHRQLRLAWAMAHEHDTEETIRRFVFSDEKSFLVTDVSHRLWLRPAEPTPNRETGVHRNMWTHISALFIHSAPLARFGALHCFVSLCPLLAWTLDIAFFLGKNAVFLVL
jgi:hypothetical protein